MSAAIVILDLVLGLMLGAMEIPREPVVDIVSEQQGIGPVGTPIPMTALPGAYEHETLATGGRP